ncbi:MAG: hypothetical protein KBD01_12000 [Acidobacteria bacterium]|nr:hypothetical protein [Acidobacteriota bacterium]
MKPLARTLLGALLLPSAVLAAAAQDPPAAPSLEYRIVYLERFTGKSAGASTSPKAQEQAYRYEDDAWRTAKGVGSDAEFAACADRLAQSVPGWVDAGTGRLFPAIEASLVELASRAGGGTLVLALLFERDVDLDSKLDEIDAGSITLRPENPPGPPGPAGPTTPGDDPFTVGGASIGTVKAPGKPVPDRTLVRRQVRLYAPDGSSRTLSSRVLGSLDHAAKNDACGLSAEGLAAALRDALTRLP